MPLELQLMIWNIAAEKIAGRTVCIQPHCDNSPSMVDACTEARNEFYKLYKRYNSHQGFMKFRFSIRNQAWKDILYLNHNFRNGKKRHNSVLTAALSVYPEIMTPVVSLAMNIKEMKKMTSKYRNGAADMWKSLSEVCP